MAHVCAGTPTIIVHDNRGLDVRTLRYNRSVDGAVAMQYVDSQTHNALGQLAASQDPRFFGSSTQNFQYTPALSGQVLKSVSADAGTSEACTDTAGQPVWQHSQGRDANLQSDKNITVRLSYDALGRPVQRTCYTADVSAGGASGGSTDIWSYGDYSGPPGATYDPTNITDTRNANQRGQLFQHFDTAGLIDMSVLGYAVQGIALRQDRRFQATPCDAATHWTLGSPQALYGLNKGLLESDIEPANLYSTRWTYNALAQAVTQVDAKGHQQLTAYDCAGRKYTASVTPNGGTLMPVCAGITYNAAGAIDTRSDANNIQVMYVYEPQTTQRLISITSSRSSTKLQALTYAYDGVGNVTALADSSASAQVSFFRNRAVTPDRGYTYDALYQLTRATGRENYVNDTPKGIDWPGGGQFSPSATPNYRPYTRSYNYDTGGNLTTIRSSNWSGATPPARQLVVGTASNRAVSNANNPGATQNNIDTYFDPAGKSIYLDANRNQPMHWTVFHQLYCVVTTYRAPTPGTGTGDWSKSDREQYAYDGSGQRVRKYVSNLANNTWNHLDTRYLPGLELRSNTASGENLEVIVLDDGARVLNWASGTSKPSDIPNLQLRYQYRDRQNSCQIETDSAGNIITHEEYYPYGGTAVLASRTDSEVKYKYIRYCDKERDATGLYYYGLRYYQPWIGRWINPDPAGPVKGQNLYCMVENRPTTLTDLDGAISNPVPGCNPFAARHNSSGRKTNIDSEPADEPPEIPKKVHLIWVGNDPTAMPAENVQDIARKLPGHKIYVHIDMGRLYPAAKKTYADKIRTLRAAGPNVVIKQFRKESSYKILKRDYPVSLSTYQSIADHGDRRNFAAAADIARYHIIKEKGGLYIDFDDTILQPAAIASLRVKQDLVFTSKFVTSFATSPDGTIIRAAEPFFNNSSFAAHRGAAPLKLLAQSLETSLPNDFRASLAHKFEERERFLFISKHTGPAMFTKAIAQSAPEIGDLVARASRLTFTQEEKESVKKRAELLTTLEKIVKTGQANTWK